MLRLFRELTYSPCASQRREGDARGKPDAFCFQSSLKVCSLIHHGQPPLSLAHRARTEGAAVSLPD